MLQSSLMFPEALEFAEEIIRAAEDPDLLECAERLRLLAHTEDRVGVEACYCELSCKHSEMRDMNKLDFGQTDASALKLPIEIVLECFRSCMQPWHIITAFPRLCQASFHLSLTSPQILGTVLISGKKASQPKPRCVGLVDIECLLFVEMNRRL